jgi:hypothetical protein
MAKCPEFALSRLGPPETKISKYEFHERASETYAHWLGGSTEEEIAEFFKLTVKEVETDLQHIRSCLPVRTILAHGNDRIRILLQREQSADFRRLLKETLQKTASEYLQSGLSPAASLREYREAIGLTQRPEPMVQVNTQHNINIGSGDGKATFSSAEDVVRSVLRAQKEEEKLPVIDVDVELESEGNPGNEVPEDNE